MQLVQLIYQMLSYSAIRNALIVGSLVSVCAALLGVSLILRRYSMIGDGLSHVGYGAVAAALCFGAAPLAVALPCVLVCAFLLLKLSDDSRVSSDSSIAMMASASLALGIIINSFSSANGADVQSYLFGSVLFVTDNETYFTAAILICVIVLFFVAYPHIFAITFDENYYRATGGRGALLGGVIAAATALTVVLGLKVMGAMLISSLIVFPPVTAMQIAKSFKGVVVLSALISLLAFIFGLVLSFVFDLPVGATVVVVNLILFLCSYSISHIWQLKKK